MFPCTRCGLCCRSLDMNKDLQFLDRGDGTCRYLNCETNECKDYQNRPLYCRVDEMYEKFFSGELLLDEYLRMNVDVCLSLQERAGIPEEERIRYEF